MMGTSRLRHRQRGFIFNLEVLLFAVVLVIGLVVGWVTIRDSFNAELVDTANAIESTITFYYFNDPNRGLGPAFVPQEYEFCQDVNGEGADLLAAGRACDPSGSTNPLP